MQWHIHVYRNRIPLCCIHQETVFVQCVHFFFLLFYCLVYLIRFLGNKLLPIWSLCFFPRFVMFAMLVIILDIFFRHTKISCIFNVFYRCAHTITNITFVIVRRLFFLYFYHGQSFNWIETYQIKQKKLTCIRSFDMATVWHFKNWQLFCIMSNGHLLQ